MITELLAAMLTAKSSRIVHH